MPKKKVHTPERLKGLKAALIPGGRYIREHLKLSPAQEQAFLKEAAKVLKAIDEGKGEEKIFRMWFALEGQFKKGRKSSTKGLPPEVFFKKLLEERRSELMDDLTEKGDKLNRYLALKDDALARKLLTTIRATLRAMRVGRNVDDLTVKHIYESWYRLKGKVEASEHAHEKHRREKPYKDERDENIFAVYLDIKKNNPTMSVRGVASHVINCAQSAAYQHYRFYHNEKDEAKGSARKMLRQNTLAGIIRRLIKEHKEVRKPTEHK